MSSNIPQQAAPPQYQMLDLIEQPGFGFGGGPALFMSDYGNMLFIHCPKTGGISFKKMMIDIGPKIDPNCKLFIWPGLGHMSIKHSATVIEKEFKLTKQDYHIVSIMRNPFDWYVSRYLHFCSTQGLQANVDLSFKAYCTIATARGRPWLSPYASFNMQTDWDQFWKGADTIIKFEHWFKEVSTLLKDQYNYDLKESQVPRNNVNSKKQDYRKYYSATLREWVETTEKQVLKNTGYTFDG